MSWIRDVEGRLINLDAIDQIECLPLAEPTDLETHLVQLQFDAGNSDDGATVFIGSKSRCMQCMSLIESKLHVIPTLVVK